MKQKTYLKDIPALLGGSILFGIALSLFLTPCDVILGGAGGIAVVLHRYFDLPVGIGILLLNLPLFILSVRMLGFTGMARTALCVSSTAICSDLLASFPAATADPLAGAVCGGIVMGAGSALMLLRGYTTGGSELAAHLICSRAPQLRLGSVILCIDTVIVVGAAMIQRDYTGILYSAAAITAYSASLDAVMSGLGKSMLSLIVTTHGSAIGKSVAAELHRGITVLDGRGFYTGEGRDVLICVVKRSEIYALKTIVRREDPSAFLIITDAAQVLGHGFSPEAKKDCRP